MVGQETYGNKGAECPHCHHINRAADDNWQLYDEGTDEWECGICSKTFKVEVLVSYSWRCSPLDTEEDETP